MIYTVKIKLYLPVFDEIIRKINVETIILYEISILNRFGNDIPLWRMCSN